MSSGRLMRLISSSSALYGEAKDGTLCKHDKGVESCSRAAAIKSMMCLALRRVKQLVSWDTFTQQRAVLHASSITSCHNDPFQRTYQNEGNRIIMNKREARI